MATIACFSVTTDKEREYFENVWGEEVIIFEKEVQDCDVIDGIENITVATSFTGSFFDAETIDKFPNLQLIAARSTGYNNIDVEHARSRGIDVVNVPVYGANTVAEYAFALILAISRKAHLSSEMVEKTMDFSARGIPELQGFDLMGKTIGVIGAGNIGKHAIKIAHGFGMNIHAFDLHPSDEMTEKYGVTWEENIESVIKASDIVTIHVPYNKHTHHLFDKNMLNYIQKEDGIVLINTSRGEVVETQAIIEGLESGKLSQVGLDVLEREGEFSGVDLDGTDPVSEEINKQNVLNRMLIDSDRVMVTPHNAFSTAEAIERIWQTTVENVATHKAGETQNVVNS